MRSVLICLLAIAIPMAGQDTKRAAVNRAAKPGSVAVEHGNTLLWDSRYRPVASPTGSLVTRAAKKTGSMTSRLPKSKDREEFDAQELLLSRIEDELKVEIQFFQVIEADLEGPLEQGEVNEKPKATNKIAIGRVKGGFHWYMGVLKKDGSIATMKFETPPYLAYIRVLKVLELTPGKGKQLLIRDKDGGSGGEAGSLSILELAEGKIRRFRDTPLYRWVRMNNGTSAVRLTWGDEKITAEYFVLRGRGAWVSMRKAEGVQDSTAFQHAVMNAKGQPLAHDPGVMANVRDAYFGSRMEKMMAKKAVWAMTLAAGYELEDKDTTDLDPLLDSTAAQRQVADRHISSGMTLVLGAPWPAAEMFGDAILAAPDYDKAWAGLGLAMLKAGHQSFARFCHRQLRILNSPLAATMQKSSKIKL